MFVRAVLVAVAIFGVGVGVAPIAAAGRTATAPRPTKADDGTSQSDSDYWPGWRPRRGHRLRVVIAQIIGAQHILTESTDLSVISAIRRVERHHCWQ